MNYLYHTTKIEVKSKVRLLCDVLDSATALYSRVRVPVGALDFQTTFSVVKCFYSDPRLSWLVCK